MKHFTKHIQDLATHANAKIQGCHVSNTVKGEAVIGAATSTLFDKQVQMVNLACQSNNDCNAMLDMKTYLSADKADLQTLRGAQKQKQPFQNHTNANIVTNPMHYCHTHRYKYLQPRFLRPTPRQNHEMRATWKDKNGGITKNKDI